MSFCQEFNLPNKVSGTRPGWNSTTNQLNPFRNLLPTTQTHTNTRAHYRMALICWQSCEQPMNNDIRRILASFTFLCSTQQQMENSMQHSEHSAYSDGIMAPHADDSLGLCRQLKNEFQWISAVISIEQFCMSTLPPTFINTRKKSSTHKRQMPEQSILISRNNGTFSD